MRESVETVVTSRASNTLFEYVMHCAIRYHLYNFKNIKNTHGGVLLLVKLQAKVSNFTKSNTPP